MTPREKAYKRVLDELYPGLVVRPLSEDSLSEGLVLSAENDVRTKSGIPLIDYYHEVECELSGGWQTGEMYEMGVSFEFQGWVDKHPLLHVEWENPGVLNLYIVEYD